ncbi:MAG: CoA-binding protein, partial [bacterium]|nr:CoA-binding protein [bacterium]
MTTADDDQQMRTILEKAKTIAVVGIKNNETEDAYRIPKYMQDHGARVLPVNPKLDSILGEDAYARLSDIEE